MWLSWEQVLENVRLFLHCVNIIDCAPVTET